MTRYAKQHLRLLTATVVAASLLLSAPAFAQAVNRPHAPNAGTQNPRAHAAFEEWRRLPQSEVICVDRALRSRRSSVWILIQRGIGPSDGGIMNIRSGCRAQAVAPLHPIPVAAVSQGAMASAAIPQYWSFHGSILRLVVDGDSRKFFYFKSGPDTDATGDKRGALALEGKILMLPGGALHQRFSGIAYAFDSHCGRISYRVDGTIRDGNRRLELQGQKPRLDAACKVVGTVLDALTLKVVELTPAAAGAEKATTPAAAEQTAAEKAAMEKTAAEKLAAEKAAAERAAAEKIAAERAVAEKMATERAAAEKALADQATADKAAAEKAATEQAAAEKAAVEKLATEQAAAEKAAVEKVAAEKATAEKAASAKDTAHLAPAEQAAAGKASAENAARLAEEKAAAEATMARTQGPLVPEKIVVGTNMSEMTVDDATVPAAHAALAGQRPQGTTMTAEAVAAYAARESRISFIYGLISGPILFSLGGIALLLLNGRRGSFAAQSETASVGARAIKAGLDVDRWKAAVAENGSAQSRMDTARLNAASERRTPESARLNSPAPAPPSL